MIGTYKCSRVAGGSADIQIESDSFYLLSLKLIIILQNFYFNCNLKTFKTQTPTRTLIFCHLICGWQSFDSIDSRSLSEMISKQQKHTSALQCCIMMEVKPADSRRRWMQKNEAIRYWIGMFRSTEIVSKRTSPTDGRNIVSNEPFPRNAITLRLCLIYILFGITYGNWAQNDFMNSSNSNKTEAESFIAWK